MPEFDWLKATEEQPSPSLAGGESGYLSAPSATLDPHLFSGETLKHDVQSTIVARLVGFLVDDLHMRHTSRWLKVWLAGSGITYQWNAGRGNGDLDVLLGVDRVPFNEANPGYAHYGDEDLAAHLNDALKAGLWPQTSHVMFGDQSYEVTYFYNSGTGIDIKRIHPYAAYDVMTGNWVVRPPALPNDPATIYPRSWFERAHQDTEYAESLVDRYHEQLRALQAADPGTPGHINAGAGINLVTAQARAMFDDIHHGRRIAFQGGAAATRTSIISAGRWPRPAVLSRGCRRSRVSATEHRKCRIWSCTVGLWQVLMNWYAGPRIVMGNHDRAMRGQPQAEVPDSEAEGHQSCQLQRQQRHAHQVEHHPDRPAQEAQGQVRDAA